MAEYQEAQAQLTLPPGAGADAWGRPLDKNVGAESVLYEPGAATTRVQMGWLCAWEREWLGTRGVDATREAEALKQIERFKDFVTYQQRFDENSRLFYDNRVAAAKLGDPSKIQEHVDLNCAP
jgi:hypothetical protein